MDIAQLRALVEWGNDQARRYPNVSLLLYEWEALSALVEENERLKRENKETQQEPRE